MASEPAPRDDATRRDAATHPWLFAVADASGGDRREAAVAAAARAALATIAQHLQKDGAAFAADVVVERVLADPTLHALFVNGEVLDRLADRLPVAEAREERPGFVARLAGTQDAAVAEAARAVLLADNARDAPLAALSQDAVERLAWLVAAAVRSGTPADDRALIAAVGTLCAEHAPAATAAVRLAGLLDLPATLEEALEDRRPRLFVALLARGYAAGFDAVAALLHDPADERLWWLCRALDLPRATIARIGVALADAEPARDLERFADTLDAVMAASPAAADARMAWLQHPPGYRAALAAAGRTA